MEENDHHAAIRAILCGDRDAYGALVASHCQRLFRIAFRITGNEADAEDVVQEALLRGYQKLETFRSRSSFGTWIYRIAVRCALDKISSRQGEESSLIGQETDTDQRPMQVADETAGPERLLLSREIGAMQETAMHGLTAIERTAFVLRHMEELTSEEISSALGITPNAAKQAVFRAVQKLRQRLGALRVNP